MMGKIDIEIQLEESERELDIEISFSIQPAEPDVGIMQPFLEEFTILSIKENGKELNDSEWPINETELGKLENIEYLAFEHLREKEEHRIEMKADYDYESMKERRNHE